MTIWNAPVGYTFSSMRTSWPGFFKTVAYDTVTIWAENNEYRRRVAVGKSGPVVSGDPPPEATAAESNQAAANGKGDGP